jgi:putative oxidoreductase
LIQGLTESCTVTVAEPQQLRGILIAFRNSTMTLIDRCTPLLARFFLIVLFPFSAIDKMIHWNAALQQANSSFLPGGQVLLVLAMIVEIVCPLLILIQHFDRLAAFVLAGFCAITAVLYHPFWKFPGIIDGSGTEGLSHFWDFLKNFGLVGGLMFVMLGARTAPLSAVAQHPLASGSERVGNG